MTEEPRKPAQPSAAVGSLTKSIKIIDIKFPLAALSAAEAALTDEAICRQLFGAPFYAFRGEPFWGQDRLDLLERAIGRGAEPISFCAAG